jgi:hypothetical protein
MGAALTEEIRMVHYECWTHRYGENYLVRMTDSTVITGVCGPLRRSDIPTANMQNFDFDSQPQHAEWIRTHRAEFTKAHERDAGAVPLEGVNPTY